MTVAEWAASEGISRVAAYKRLKRAGVEPQGGQIDAASVRAAWQGSVDAAQQQRGAASRGKFGLPKLPNGRSAVPGNGTAARPVDFIRSLAQAQALSKGYEARERQLRVQRIEGSLIDAEQVRGATEARFREDAQALLDWPSRVSAEMAAELGIEERLVYVALNQAVRSFMRERSMAGIGEAV